jgi:pyruvate dehydrogenase E2 component (dihydrolipoamide acetyltransferase)
MTKELADKAKTGKLLPDDYTGGSFTISNLGMFGLNSFVAIINPPETGILAVGRIAKTAVVTDDDEIVIRPMCELTLSYDHRVIDGAPAAQFLAQVKRYLEQPYLLL